MTNPARHGYPVGDQASAVKIVPVTPGDATLFKTCRGLLVGTAGAATVIDGSGETRTLIPLQAGYNPISVQAVFSTDLTAADIWALY